MIMAKTIVTILAYLILFLLDFLNVFNTKDKKKISVYLLFYFSAFILSLLISLDIRIPSLDLTIKKIFFD